MTWLGLARVSIEPAPAMLRNVPLPSRARVTFPLRGTCDTCGREHVCCAPRGASDSASGAMQRDAERALLGRGIVEIPRTVRTMVCADCVMTGRGVLS